MRAFAPRTAVAGSAIAESLNAAAPIMPARFRPSRQYAQVLVINRQPVRVIAPSGTPLREAES